MFSRCWLVTFGALTLVRCASVPPTHKWVNEVDPTASYHRDYRECEQEAEATEKLAAANIAGSVALALNIAKHRGDCLAARGWRAVSIDGGTNAMVPVPGAVPVELLSNPSGAEVYVDGALVGSTPVRALRLAPGRHTVEVRRRGMAVWSRELTVQAGTPITLHAELEGLQP